MALSRYASLDTYTSEELRREYHLASPKGRVRLLKKLARKGELGEEIEQIAVEDQNAVVRQWVARNADLSEQQIERLKADSDDFVRACLFENPAISEPVFWGPEASWLAWFKEANHAERLAMMRNPVLRDQFIEIVFDPEDAKLGIDLEERTQLVFAFLSNSRRVEANLRSFDDPDVGRNQKRHFAMLWTLASRWPSESGVQQRVYRNVTVDGETKVRVYRQCEAPFLRMAILENDLPELNEEGEKVRDPSKVLDIAKKDSDETCRQLAYSKSPKRPEPTPVLNALFYSWTAAWSLIEMFIAVLLLRSAVSKPETVTYTILIFIYVEVRLQASGLGFVMSRTALLASQRHMRVLSLLDTPESTKKPQETIEAIAVEEGELSRLTTVLTIEALSLRFIATGAAIYLVITILQRR